VSPRRGVSIAGLVLIAGCGPLLPLLSVHHTAGLHVRNGRLTAVDASDIVAHQVRPAKFRGGAPCGLDTGLGRGGLGQSEDRMAVWLQALARNSLTPTDGIDTSGE